MKRQVYEDRVRLALEYYAKAGIILTDEEKSRIEVVDFELGMVETCHRRCFSRRVRA